MKRILIGVGVAAVAGALYLWFGGGSSANGTRQEIKRVRAERGDVDLSISATGEVMPVRQVELKSKASGQVVRFPKVEGEIVEAGELIAELDKKLESRNLEREEANLKAAEARLALMRLEYERSLRQAQSEVAAATEDAATQKKEQERMERLEGGVMTETDLAMARLNARLAEEKLLQAEAALALARDRKTADEDLAESEVARARSTVAEARERLADTEVRSPIAGILLKKQVEEGQIVSSGISSTSGGTTIAIVADVSALVVVTNVDETDIGKVNVGQEAWVSVEARPDERFRGRVELIPPKGEIDSSIVVFKVKVGLEGKHFGRLKASMTATVTIRADEHKGVVWVPSEAVRSEKGRRYVLGADGQRRIDVKTGLDDGTRCEIVEGLQEGDEVAIVAAISAPESRRRMPGRW
ncbi:MAG: efflux RND transporter periplasmic adaptor subunit [Planctomycetes bacterium]|nr:efflux RND transporter periplasmic adaptor subunit [Planctomycetota bacterium]